MSDFKNCLPADARGYYIELSKHRAQAERTKHDAAQQKLLREAAARGHVRSGGTCAAQWNLRAEYLDATAIGFVEDLLTVYEERELALTPTTCTCIANTAHEHLNTVYQQQLKLSAEGLLGFHLLNSSVQEMSTRKFQAMPKINIMIERARMASAKREGAGKQPPATINHITNNTYMQNVSGSHNAVTMLGDVAQQQQFNFNQLAVELESLRSKIKSQTIDAEDLKLLEDATSAAKEHDETKLRRCLRAISKGAWEAAKSAGVELSKQGLIELARAGIHLLH